MWPPHRQAALTSGCVRPGPRPGLVCCPCVGPGLACCPCVGPGLACCRCMGPGLACCPCPDPVGRGRPLPGRLSTAAALYSELTCYLESMLRLAFQSGGENEEIRVQVSSVGVRGEQSSDSPGLQRGGRGAPTARSSDWGSGPGLGLGLGSMWDGFSVDRYAPRVRSAAGPQHLRAEEVDGARRRPRTAPGGRKSPGGSGAARRGRLGRVARATGASAPGDDVAEVASFSAPGDDAAVARVTERPPPPRGGSSSRRRRRRRAPCPPVAAYQRFVQQYRAALGWAAGTGQADGERRAAASDYEVKATKLVEQRHERIRKTILEKERKEQMEKRRLVNERLKRRALERHIAARMCLHEMEWYRKDQARSRLQSLRSCNREQAAQYQADLQEMKERVARTPFLFEQVIQNNIRSTIDRLFTRVLQRQQLDEGLVLKLSAVGTPPTARQPRHVHLERSPEDCARDGEPLPPLVDPESPQESGGWDGEPAASGGEDPRPEVNEEEPPPPAPSPPPLADTPRHECSNVDCTAGLIPPDC